MDVDKGREQDAEALKLLAIVRLTRHFGFLKEPTFGAMK